MRTRKDRTLLGDELVPRLLDTIDEDGNFDNETVLNTVDKYGGYHNLHELMDAIRYREDRFATIKDRRWRHSADCARNAAEISILEAAVNAAKILRLA